MRWSPTHVRKFFYNLNMYIVVQLIKIGRKHWWKYIQFFSIGPLWGENVFQLFFHVHMNIFIHYEKGLLESQGDFLILFIGSHRWKSIWDVSAFFNVLRKYHFTFLCLKVPFVSILIFYPWSILHFVTLGACLLTIVVSLKYTIVPNLFAQFFS